MLAGVVKFSVSIIWLPGGPHHFGPVGGASSVLLALQVNMYLLKRSVRCITEGTSTLTDLPIFKILQKLQALPKMVEGPVRINATLVSLVLPSQSSQVSAGASVCQSQRPE